MRPGQVGRQLESASSFGLPQYTDEARRVQQKNVMNQELVTQFPVTDRVREAMAVSLRGTEELIPQEDWLR